MKKLLALALSLVCAFSVLLYTDWRVSADSSAETSDDNSDFVDLLSSYYLSLTSSSNKMFLTGSVAANETMAEVGFIDFEVQRAYSSTGSWSSTYYSIPNQLAYNKRSKSISDYPVPVLGGFYYRVCFHAYAKEDAWLFPDTETEWYESPAVYVP